MPRAVRNPLRLLALAALAPLALASVTIARQEAPAPNAEAVRLMDAARDRLTLGDTTGAIARALLAREIDAGVEIPAIIIARAALADAPAPGASPNPALLDLRSAVGDLERQVRDQARILEGVERDLRDDARAEPVVQRLEREIDDLERKVDDAQRDLARLQREVDRLRR